MNKRLVSTPSDEKILSGKINGTSHELHHPEVNDLLALRKWNIHCEQNLLKAGDCLPAYSGIFILLRAIDRTTFKQMQFR